MLKEIRRLTNDISLLLTCRSHLEGGFQKVASKTRDVLYKEIAFGGDIAKVAVMLQSMEDVLN